MLNKLSTKRNGFTPLEVFGLLFKREGFRTTKRKGIDSYFSARQCVSKRRQALCPKKSTGFTLIEVIGALFVVSVGIIAIFSLIIQTTSLLDISSDRLIAAYLAQEGLETIRNIRDANILRNDNWDKDISADTSYKLDYKSQKFPDNCQLATGNYLKYNNTDKTYNCSSGTASKFKRQIIVSKPNSTTTNIVVKVEWSSKNRNHQITGQENLYDWQ